MDVGFVDYVGFVDPTALTCPRCHGVSRKDPTIFVYSWMGRCPFWRMVTSDGKNKIIF